ncbi:MAG: amino acid ABC transporter substrate-binding protein [Desulfobacterales bacterium]|nr:amino acid ABC transporter substrate-binding protein [Desulfobacterales bacterium]
MTPRVGSILAWTLSLLLGTGAAFASNKASAPDRPLPYKRMLEDDLQFNGHRGAPAAPASLEEIRVGVFSPDESADPASKALLQGARLAVEEANQGRKGPPFRLIRRWADNPWAAGSSEMIRLAYRDRAWAVIGHLGAASHIASQIAVKGRFPVITPLSSDPSLTHARVPWIFRLPPDDQAQARVLVRQGVRPRGLKRVGLLTSTDPDGRMGADALRAEMAKEGVPPLFHLPIGLETPDVRGAVRRARTFNPDGLILRLPRPDLLTLLDALEEKGARHPVFLPWIPGLDMEALPARYGGEIVAVQPFRPEPGYEPWLRFTRAYTARYGQKPSFAAAYAFDAANMILQAIGNRDLTRVDLRDRLAGMKDYPGAGGPVRWDTGGGNHSRPIIRTLPGKRD